MEIKDSVFLVTGGGSGLGAATARKLADSGARVLVADVNEEAGRQVAKDIGERARFTPTDVADEESVKEAIAAAVDTFGGLRGVVGCAGIAPAAKVVGKRGPHPLGSFELTVRVNLVGTFNVARLAAAAMVEEQAG